MNRRAFLVLLCSLCIFSEARTQATVPAFAIGPNDLAVTRLAQPNTYFDKVGRKFAVLGYESGTFEAWAYPLKLFRNVGLSFLIGSSTEPIAARDIVRFIAATPEATTLTYSFQSFTVTATFVTPIDEPGAYVLLGVDTAEPLTIVCSFLPVLQPMWPAGIGGQSARWLEEMKAYHVTEPTRRNHAFIGSPSADGISYTPAHMLSDKPNQFSIVVDKPETVRGRFIPIVMAGGRGDRDSIKAIYTRLVQESGKQYTRAREHYANLRAETMRIYTPEAKLNLAFEWAKVSYDNLFVDNPDVGLGMVAGLGTSGTGGRPGFGWFFGGDAYINSFSLNSFGATSSVKDALRFTRQWQRDDGKMAHELTQAAAYIDWWQDYPYGYIHGDTSPFYICAVWDYFLHTADSSFVRESWESIRRAYDWSLKTDADGDGLMDNKKAGLGALEYGPLTDIQSDIYTGAIWVRAATTMEELARVAGRSDEAESAFEYGKKASGAFDAKFWDEKRERYAYAFTPDGKHVDIVSPWSSVGLMWGLGTMERSLKSLSELNSAELSTDWGIRSISNKSSYYESLNYNYGAVWPFLSSWVATAQFKHRRGLQGYSLLMANAEHTFDNAIGHITEVFSGSHNIWPQEAVAHQGFSTAGLVLPLTRGLFGLEPRAHENELTFSPVFPADWDSVVVESYRMGSAEYSFTYVRHGTRIQLSVRTIGGEETTLRFEPVFGPGTGVASITSDVGDAIRDVSKNERYTRVSVAVPLRGGATTIEIELKPTVELLPPPLLARTGDGNASMKIISVTQKGDRLLVIAEGLAGREYRVGLTNAHLIASVEGCSVDGNEAVVLFEKKSAPVGEFVRREFGLIVRRSE